MSEDPREGDVSRLLRLAGPRPTVSPEVTARVLAAVHGEWRSQVRARRQRHRAIAGYVVVGAALVAAQALNMAPRPVVVSPGPPVLFLERTLGKGVQRVNADDGASALTTGAGLGVGAWLETPPGGRAAFRTAGGGSLRLDMDTRVRVLSSSLVWLERGGIYFDGGARPGATRMEVLTHWSRVRDVGTQFEVRAAPLQTEVRVREGRIILLHTRGQGRHEAQAGSGLLANPLDVARSDVATHGPSWSWVEETAPEFAIEGRSLESFLAWVARETGWEIRFSDETRARSAAGVTLHGSSAGLTPSQALEAVLPTCGLTLRREGGTAWIEPAAQR